MQRQDKVDYTLMNDKQLKEYIIDKLDTSTDWLRHAVKAIYERQTQEEQAQAATHLHNGQGFSAMDAGFLTSIARQIILNQRSLSERQVTATRKAMRKYAGQLVKIVRENYPQAASNVKAMLTAPTAVSDSGLVDGREYDLGAVTAIYNAEGDFFDCGNSIVQRFDTIYW